MCRQAPRSAPGRGSAQQTRPATHWLRELLRAWLPSVPPARRVVRSRSNWVRPTLLETRLAASFGPALLRAHIAWRRYTYGAQGSNPARCSGRRNYRGRWIVGSVPRGAGPRYQTGLTEWLAFRKHTSIIALTRI